MTTEEKKLIKQIESEITECIKDEIKRQYQSTGHLIKTGKMIKSINTKNIDQVFKIGVVDYFKYLNIPFSIMENVEKSKRWKNVLELIKQLYELKIIFDLTSKKP